MRLIGGGGILAVYVAVIYPAGLLDEVPTVLGLRTFALTSTDAIDAVVPVRSLLERVNRLEAAVTDDAQPITMTVPMGVNTVTWAAISPPKGGWHARPSTTSGVLNGVARAGIDEVAGVIPAGTGAQIVQRVRAEVWGRAIDGLEDVPGRWCLRGAVPRLSRRRAKPTRCGSSNPAPGPGSRRRAVTCSSSGRPGAWPARPARAPIPRTRHRGSLRSAATSTRRIAALPARPRVLRRPVRRGDPAHDAGERRHGDSTRWPKYPRPLAKRRSGIRHEVERRRARDQVEGCVADRKSSRVAEDELGLWQLGARNVEHPGRQVDAGQAGAGAQPLGEFAQHEGGTCAGIQDVVHAGDVDEGSRAHGRSGGASRPRRTSQRDR